MAKSGGPRQSLSDLKTALADQQRARQDQGKPDQQATIESDSARKAREQESDEFRNAIADVVPLADSNRAEPTRKQIAPVPRQRELDEDEALAASLSDEIDVGQFLDTDESLSYTAPGVGPDVVVRLRRGLWAVSAQVDLHGLRRDEAREVLIDFLDECRINTKRCVRVIHGKGLGSVNREPVLKQKVRKWLVQRPDVLAFCQTRPNDGGSGALLVLLAGRAKSASMK